jgi:hypothetical protein
VSTAQYVVQIAADMPAGEKTIGQLDELTRQLLASGVGADALHDAVATASNALASARDVTVAANAALAEGNAEFARLEKAALQAGKAQEKAARLGVVPPDVAASLAAASADLETHTTKLRELERAAAAAKGSEAGLATTLNNVKQAATAGNAALAEQKKVTAEASKEHDQLTRKSEKEAESMVPLVKNWNDFTDAMGTSKGQMILAVGAAAGLALAVAAVTVAIIAATIAIAAWAIGLADANRDAGIAREAMEAMHPELAALSGAIDDVADKTGLHANELQEWAGKLKAAKVTAEDMPEALRAVANAQAALGQGGAAELVEQFKEGKQSAAALSAEVNGKLGPLVEARMKGLGALSARFERNIASLFGGLNIEPVLDGLSTLVNLFDENTAAGSAMKLLFESVFQPMIDQAEKAAYFVEAFVLGFLIGMTKLYIAVKPAIKAVSEFFGFEDTNLTDGLNVAKIAGEVVVPVFLGFVAVIGAVIAVVALAAAQLLLIPAAMAAVVAAVVYAGVQVVQWVIGAWTQVTDYLNGIVPGLGELASNLMQGLIGGILGAGPAFINALIGVVSGGITAAKKLLGIASPSRVFAEIGDNTGAGLVEGVEGVTGDVQDAFATMVEPPDVPASALEAQDTPWGASTAPAGGASGGPQVSDSGPSGAAKGGGGGRILEGATLYFYGVKDAENARDLFEEMLTKVLEGDAASIAGEAAPA